MSNHEPTGLYVYQPDPADANGGYIFAISGPMNPLMLAVNKARFKTRESAQEIVTALNGAWVRVNERVPEDEGRYLLAWRWDDTTGPFENTGEFFPEGEDPEGWIVDGISGEPEIVAWMPLPAPYEQKGE